MAGSGSLCIGCGLKVTPEGILLVATSGTFEGLNLPGSDTGGQVVYCDHNGVLRTAPPKFSVRAAESETTNGDYSPGNGDSSVRVSIETQITNPSPHYPMVVEIFPNAIFDMSFRGDSGSLVVERQWRQFTTGSTGYTNWATDESGVYSLSGSSTANTDTTVNVSGTATATANSRTTVSTKVIGSTGAHFSAARGAVLIPPSATFRGAVRAQVRGSGVDDSSGDNPILTRAIASLVMVGRN